MLRRNPPALVLLLATVLCAGSASAATKNYDQVKPVVGIPAGEPVPIIVNNGTVPGTIQLLYTLTANQFTAGYFARFNVNLSILAGSTSSTYPTTLTLGQDGSTNVELSPDPSSFDVNDRGFTGNPLVTISIPSSVPPDPTLNCDGCTLVGNLNLDTPGISHLGAPTTIQVKIVLVHPALSLCLKLYHFVLNNDTGDIITSATYNVNPHTGKVTGTQPGVMLDAVMLANTCPDVQQFDVRDALDVNFETLPHNNPGNAVFTYNTTGVIDDTTFTLGSFGTGTGQQQNLCLSPLTLAAGDTFLMTVKMDEVSGITPTASATFTAKVSVSGTSCDPNQPHPLVTPNPAATTLTLTQN